MRDALAEDAPPAAPVSLPGRGFTWNGEDWWVQELGRTRSGRRGDRGADLLLLGFRLAAGDMDAFPLEALVHGTSLDAIHDDELERLAGAAGPFRPIPDEPPPFFGTRGGDRGEPPVQARRGPGRRGRT